jgi:acylphosphatase
MSQQIVHVAIHGQVQGVGYRAWTARRAGSRGLKGWVRNCRDGSVEAVFAGEADEVEAMIAECRDGPYGARVVTVEREDIESTALDSRQRGERFSVLPTA